jgi:hypothetical protein
VKTAITGRKSPRGRGGGKQYNYVVKSYHVGIRIDDPARPLSADLGWGETLFYVHATSQKSLEEAYYQAVDKYRSWQLSEKEAASVIPSVKQRFSRPPVPDISDFKND